MLSRLADIYRIVTPEPTDSFITQRKQTIETLATDDAIGTHLPDWIELIYMGVPSEPEQRPPAGIKAMIKVLQEVQPSFPSDPIEKALDLRVTAAAVLGEYLREPPEDQRRFACVVAALILSTSGLRLSLQEPRFGSLVDGLREAAQSVLDEKAVAIRARETIALPAVKGADVGALASSISAALRAFHDVIVANIRADREEVEILWWVFGRYSTTLKAPYADLAPGDAAIAAATELSRLMLSPPIPAASDFLRTLLENKPSLSLSNLVTQARLSTLRLLVPDEQRLQELARRQAALLPMTWLGSRLVESDKSPWDAEFQRKTKLSPTIERSTSDWAEQIFAERTSIRILGTDWLKAETE